MHESEKWKWSRSHLKLYIYIYQSKNFAPMVCILYTWCFKNKAWNLKQTNKKENGLENLLKSNNNNNKKVCVSWTECKKQNLDHWLQTSGHFLFHSLSPENSSDLKKTKLKVFRNQLGIFLASFYWNVWTWTCLQWVIIYRTLMANAFCAFLSTFNIIFKPAGSTFSRPW